MPALRQRPRPMSPVVAAPRTVQRSRRRFLQRVRARRWRLLKRVLVALVAVGLVAAGVWLVFFSSVTAVKGSAVSGVEVLSEDEVRRAAQVPSDVPLATVDLAAVQARVEQLAAVRSAEVSRAWPDTVSVEVTEREAVVAVEREGSWRGVDDQGVVFRDYPEQPKDLPTITMRASTSVEALAEAAQVVGSSCSCATATGSAGEAPTRPTTRGGCCRCCSSRRARSTTSPLPAARRSAPEPSGVPRESRAARLADPRKVRDLSTHPRVCAPGGAVGPTFFSNDRLT